jgi:hypothetical protein
VLKLVFGREFTLRFDMILIELGPRLTLDNDIKDYCSIKLIIGFFFVFLKKKMEKKEKKKVQQ